MERLGLGLWGGVSTHELVDAVALADKRGFSRAYLIESFADVFGVLSACARETERIELASGVATVFTRNPTTIAIDAATKRPRRVSSSPRRAGRRRRRLGPSRALP